MSKTNNIWIPVNLPTSKAYRELRGKSHLIYPIFCQKRQMVKSRSPKGNYWEIKNNGKITFTYAEAESLGISRRQFRDGLDDLIAKGFLQITHEGTGTGDPSTFKIIDNWRDYGTPDFKSGKKRRANMSGRNGWSVYNRKQKSSDKNDTGAGDKNDTGSAKNQESRCQ